MRGPQCAFDVGDRGEVSDEQPIGPRDAMNVDDCGEESNRMRHGDQVTGAEQYYHGTQDEAGIIRTEDGVATLHKDDTMREIVGDDTEDDEDQCACQSTFFTKQIIGDPAKDVRDKPALAQVQNEYLQSDEENCWKMYTGHRKQSGDTQAHGMCAPMVSR